MMALAPFETVGIIRDSSGSRCSAGALAGVSFGHEEYLPAERRLSSSCIIDGDDDSSHTASSTAVGLPGLMLKAGVSLIIFSGNGTCILTGVGKREYSIVVKKTRQTIFSVLT